MINELLYTDKFETVHFVHPHLSARLSIQQFSTKLMGEGCVDLLIYAPIYQTTILMLAVWF